MRLGLLGGTFDPIHLGHLILAQEALEQFKLDRVVFVPAYLPPHKKGGCVAAPRDRLKMVALAIAGDARFKVSSFEMAAGKKSYTIDTVKAFRKRMRESDELYFIAGSDSLEGLPKWKGVDEILRLTHFIVAERSNYDIDKRTFRNKVIAMPMPAVDISSSAIRARAAKGASIKYLVPAAVAGYIEKRRLYNKPR